MAKAEFIHGVNHDYMQVDTQSQQLEQARVLWETWRSVPVLAKTLCLLQDIVKNPYALIITKVTNGTAIETRGVKTESRRKQVELIVRKIQSLPASIQPRVINCNTWSGLHGTLHPITVNHARA